MVTKSKLAKQRLSFNVFDSLTKSSFKKYKPKAKDYYIRDEKLEGFWIRVYPSGKKVYGAYTRKGGVGRKIATTIGDCELWNFEDAKTKAKEIIQQIKYEGIVPKEKVQQEASKDKNLFDLAEDYSVETAMVFGEVYRHNNEWKFRAVGQGYSGGLQAMCHQYGVDI